MAPRWASLITSLRPQFSLRRQRASLYAFSPPPTLWTARAHLPLSWPLMTANFSAALMFVSCISALKRSIHVYYWRGLPSYVGRLIFTMEFPFPSVGLGVARPWRYRSMHSSVTSATSELDSFSLGGNSLTHCSTGLHLAFCPLLYSSSFSAISLLCCRLSLMTSSRPSSAMIFCWPNRRRLVRTFLEIAASSL